MAIIGIDLGTTNSLACVWGKHGSELIPNSFGEFLTPSVIGIDDNGEILVGKIAKERLITHPDLTVNSFKRFMGMKKHWKLGKHKFTPEELSALILKSLIQDAEAYLKEPVEEIIISVPAYFSDDQRWATKVAGQIAGAKVGRLINEPSAAALANHMGESNDKEFLVIDFGGGTLDVSVVDAFENIIEIVSVAGNNQLGGDDFNQVIVDNFLEYHNLTLNKLSQNEKAILMRQAELCKRMLSIQDSVILEVKIQDKEFTLEITNDKLTAWSFSILQKLKKCVERALKDASKNIEGIDEIILVGGSCKMPVVKNYIQYFTKIKLSFYLNPDHAVGLGCGSAAGIKQRNEDIKDVLLTDICPFSLGVGTHIENARYKRFSPIIERNSILPCSREETYYTIQDNQTKVAFSIYQGESLIADQNLKLGEIEIPVPKDLAGNQAIIMRLTYDINGILEADATVVDTGLKKHLLILSGANRMHQHEVDKCLKDMAKLKFHPRDKEENKYILEKGKRMYMESIGAKRQEIGDVLEYFVNALNRQNIKDIENAYQTTLKVLKYYDEQEEELVVKNFFDA